MSNAQNDVDQKSDIANLRLGGHTSFVFIFAGFVKAGI
jgi:hypothetical protein